MQGFWWRCPEFEISLSLCSAVSCQNSPLEWLSSLWCEKSSQHTPETLYSPYSHHKTSGMILVDKCQVTRQCPWKTHITCFCVQSFKTALQQNRHAEHTTSIVDPMLGMWMVIFRKFNKVYWWETASITLQSFKERNRIRPADSAEWYKKWRCCLKNNVRRSLITDFELQTLTKNSVGIWSHKIWTFTISFSYDFNRILGKFT